MRSRIKIIRENPCSSVANKKAKRGKRMADDPLSSLPSAELPASGSRGSSRTSQPCRLPRCGGKDKVGSRKYKGRICCSASRRRARPLEDGEEGGNGVAETSAFPNRVWERGWEGDVGVARH